MGKIHTFTPECDLDAGGLPLIWLTGVTAPESIRFLLSIIKNDTGTTRDEVRITDAAMAAIALHADPAADPAHRRTRGSKPARKTSASGNFLAGKFARPARI